MAGYARSNHQYGSELGGQPAIYRLANLVPSLRSIQGDHRSSGLRQTKRTGSASGRGLCIVGVLQLLS
jgi:hypothetical protein